MFYAIATGSKGYAESSDGINWSESSILGGTLLCYGNGTIVLVEAGNISYHYAYSSNRDTWYSWRLPVTEDWSAICYGERFVLVANNSDVYLHSSDGVNWKNRHYKLVVLGLLSATGTVCI